MHCLPLFRWWGIATSRAMTTPNFSVHTATSVNDFLDYLLPNAAHWQSAERGDLAYRGQPSSNWPLVPRAFRAQGLTDYQPDAPTGGSNLLVQVRAEFRAVHQFVKAANTSGLQIGEPGGRLLLQEDPRYIFKDEHWEHRWPQEEVLDSLALAQHHGIPTRLLDFTEDPLVAAYFAASYAWDTQKRKRLPGRERMYLAVWVIDLRFIRALNRLGGRYPERIGEIRVPRANNPYLHAQFGFFLVDRGANDLMRGRELLSIDRAAADRASFWHNGNRLAGKGIKQTWFDELPLRQVRLRSIHTGKLLRELESHGITKASVMPSLDRVVESLELQRSIR